MFAQALWLIAVFSPPSTPLFVGGQYLPTSLDGASGFVKPERWLRSYLRTHRLSRSPVRLDGGRRFQHFCVVGYRPATVAKPAGAARSTAQTNEVEFAWVYWRERNALILWEPTTHFEDSEPIYSRRVIDLEQDVVATEEEVGGSTYLVTRRWVDGVLSDCSRYGTQHSL